MFELAYILEYEPPSIQPRMVIHYGAILEHDVKDSYLYNGIPDDQNESEFEYNSRVSNVMGMSIVYLSEFTDDNHPFPKIPVPQWRVEVFV